MAKSIGTLIQSYIKANRARHNQYARRSKMGKDKWTKADQEKLDTARLKKLKASKELRAYLKKNGLCVVWGDMNQIISIETIERRNKQRKAWKKQQAKWAAERASRLMDKLDI
jgi:hypothetical protein